MAFRKILAQYAEEIARGKAHKNAEREMIENMKKDGGRRK